MAGKTGIQGEEFASDILSNINNTLAPLVKNPGLCREGPAVNPRSRGMTIVCSFDVLLTVHLSTILVINQLNAQILVL